MKKLILLLIIFISIQVKAQIPMPDDTIPRYQIMIGSASFDSTRVINDTIYYKLIRTGQIMDKWDDIHRDSINNMNYVNTPDITRITPLKELDSIGLYLYILGQTWEAYQLGNDSLLNCRIALQNLKVHTASTTTVNDNIKDIISKTDIINSKRTKIIYTPKYKK